MSRHISFLLAFPIMLGILSSRNVEGNSHPCAPITTENVNRLSAFFEKDFSTETSSGQKAIWSPSSRYNAIWSPDSTHVFDLGSQFTINNSPSPAVLETVQKHPIDVFQPDGTSLVFRYQDGILTISNGETGKIVNQLNVNPANELRVDDEGRWTIALSPDGKLLAVGDGNGWVGSIQVWNMATGKRLITLKGHGEGTHIESLAFNLDGTLLASGAGTSASAPLLWNISTGTTLYDFSNNPDNHVFDIAFNPTRNVFAFIWQHSVVFTEVKALGNRSQDRVLQFSVAGTVFHGVFSPDGNLFAVIGVRDNASDRSYAEVWDVSTLTVLRRWDLDDGFMDTSFSPDGCFLTITSAGNRAGLGILKFWRID